MIFHPAYRDEYEVTCEGLSRWHGALAWQIHFRQRPDRPVRLREYSVAKQVFPIALRGRAWIATDTYQVVSSGDRPRRARSTNSASGRTYFHRLRARQVPKEQ